MKFTVKRPLWQRGGGEKELSYLLSSVDNKMCCLGFMGIFCGIDPNMMLDVEAPSGIDISGRSAVSTWTQKFQEPEKLFDTDDVFNTNTSEVCLKLMRTNDDDSIMDDEREERLKKEFSSIGIEVSFVD